MEKLETADELACILCRELYECTDGRAEEWRKAVGGGSLYAIVERAVENGWLIVDDWDSAFVV